MLLANFRFLRVTCLSAAVTLVCLLSSPAQAVIGGADTASYSAVGDIMGASGVQIADNWVLTASHVAGGVTPNQSIFEGLTGSSIVDAVYRFSDSSAPVNGNDIALLHLRVAIQAALPTLNGVVISNEQASKLGELTIVSAQNNIPNGYGVTYGHAALDTYDNAGTPSTVNWLITEGGASVQGGDSGGALFKGTPGDSRGALLLGIVSAAADEITYDGNPTASTFVQVAAYKAWINATMAGSGQQATWASRLTIPAPQSSVPEPSTAYLFLLCAATGAAVALNRRT